MYLHIYHRVLLIILIIVNNVGTANILHIESPILLSSSAFHGTTGSNLTHLIAVLLLHHKLSYRAIVNNVEFISVSWNDWIKSYTSDSSFTIIN